MPRENSDCTEVTCSLVVNDCSTQCLAAVQDGTSPYFGAVVGRVANRIAGATFELDGTTYNLSANDPPNSLHGGVRGWSRMAWRIVRREAFDDGGSSVTLEYISPHMDEARSHSMPCPCHVSKRRTVQHKGHTTRGLASDEPQ